MINLDAVVAIEGGKRPECKGYNMVITGIKNTPSKSTGNPMYTIESNIADGEFKGYFKYPLRLFQVVNDANGLGKLKGIFQTIVNDNPLQFPGGAEAINWSNFEETTLVGAVVGGVLKWDDKGYLDISYFTTKEEAAKVLPKPKPEPKVIGDNGDGGLF